MYVSSDTMDGLYRGVLHGLLHEGPDGEAAETSPRGMKTREVVGAKLVLDDPHFNVVTLPERKLNYAFMAAEFLWMMSGSNRIDLIEPFNKNITMAADAGDDAFRGAYGPKIVEQLPYVVEVLREDRDSRQAIISIWRERPRRAADIPCTLTMQFLLRDDQLQMITYMRSNDAWLGLPYDVFSFTMIQRVVAQALNTTVGRYTHFVGSLHLYERDFERANDVVSDTTEYVPLFVPEFIGPYTGRVGGLFADLATVRQQSTVEYDTYVGQWAERTKNVEGAWRDILMVASTRFWGGAEFAWKWDSIIGRK